MNKSDYLLKKAEMLHSLKQKSEAIRPICLECFRPSRACFCSVITPFSTQVHFRILMHPMEAKRNQVGTGRMTNRALENCRIITSEGFEKNKEVNEIINNPKNEVLLLYPSQDALNISHQKLIVDETKTLYIFILDSTWACSKKMLRLSPNLRKLPKISFEPNYLSRFAIKRQPKEYCLSTIESVYRVIQELKKQDIEKLGHELETLPEVLEKMVNFHLACAKETDNKQYRGRRKS